MPLHKNLGFDPLEARRLGAIIAAEDFAECLAEGAEDDEQMNKPAEAWREDCKAVCEKLATGHVYVSDRFQAAILRFAADRAAIYADEAQSEARGLHHIAYGIRANIQRSPQQA